MTWDKVMKIARPYQTTELNDLRLGVLFSRSPNSFLDPTGKLVEIYLQILQSPVRISCCGPRSRKSLSILGRNKQIYVTVCRISYSSGLKHIFLSISITYINLQNYMLYHIKDHTKSKTHHGCALLNSNSHLVTMSNLYCNQKAETVGGSESLRKHTWSTRANLFEIHHRPNDQHLICWTPQRQLLAYKYCSKLDYKLTQWITMTYKINEYMLCIRGMPSGSE